MSTFNVETTEQDPAATSLPNDETVNKNGDDPSAPMEKDVVAATAEPKEINGTTEAGAEKIAEKIGTATDAKEESDDVKTEENNGAATYVKKEKGHKETEENGTSQKKKQRTYDDGVLKTSGRVQDGERFSKNSKYDPSILPTTDDPSKIRAQVEFYFSDANLPTDKHLWNLTDGTTNLPVSISKICEFGRMRRFQPISAVVAALRDSHFLDVTGPEGHEQVKRKVAYDPNSGRSKSESRSVYVKGFGDEEPSSQFDIEAFFAPYGPTNAVRLRRTQEKLFKGSVFVEFADDETAEKFLALEPKPLWKSKHPLIIQSKKEYTDRKEQEIKDGKLEPAETWAPGRGRGRGRGGRGGSRGERGFYKHERDGRGRGDARGDRDPDDWKKRREEDRASGFKDNHRKNDRGRRDGDRKGRGGRRDDRAPRNDDRNREREEKDREIKDERSKEVENEKKRPRGNEDGTDEKPAKKIDSKSDEVSALKVEESLEKNEKKRVHEDDGADETPSKNVDAKSEVAVEAS